MDDDPTRLRRVTISPDGVVLTVVSGASRGTVLRVLANEGATITMGKARENDLVLTDDTVSRRHCRFERTRAGLRVLDLGSTNGIRIGGARIKEAFVEPGAIVFVGDVEIAVGVELSDVEVPASDVDQFEFAYGTSAPMRRIFGVLERIAPTMATVLLLGETGTGKDVLARSVHARSPRATRPFEVLDCGAITPSLIESELFGHERGAFTGAHAVHAGVFERAQGGTVFLDELGELPLDLQPKLLRVLESREFRRVGGNKSLPADVRVIAATTRDLREAIVEGKFREDLYFRLAVVTLDVPPLRARTDDLPILTRRLLDSIEGGKLLSVPGATLAALAAYGWPGNVRELRNVLERAALITSSMNRTDLALSDFPPRSAKPSGEDFVSFDPAASYRETRAEFEAGFEERYVRWLIQRHNWNISAAARSARMDRNHLSELMRRHGVVVKR